MSTYSVAANYASAFLTHLDAVANGAAPFTKITPSGYLSMLLNNRTGLKVLNQGYDLGDGRITDVRVAYQKRGVERNVDTTIDCDISVVPSYLEVTTSIGNVVKMAIHIDDETLARYDAQANVLRSIPGSSPASFPGFMQEHLDSLLNQVNAVLQKMDRVLLTKQASNFGGNANNSNSNAAKTVNFPVDVTNQALNTGMNEILYDYQFNENTNQPLIVGGGLFWKYAKQQMVKGLDNGGINTALWQPEYSFFADTLSQTVWGSNQIGVFAPGAVSLLTYNRYAGNKAGDKLSSYNFTMPLPIGVDSLGNSYPLTFDAKLIHVDCPTSVTVGPYNDPITAKEGWNIIISLSYDQFNIPSDAYDTGDRLTTDNGSYRYTITNS